MREERQVRTRGRREDEIGAARCSPNMIYTKNASI
jgi:hypothetical protein